MFILKKILGSLLKPLPLSLLFILVGYFLLRKSDSNPGRKRFGNGLAISGLFLILLASNGSVSRLLVAPLEQKFPPFQDQEVQAVLVLGSYHKSAPGLPVTSIIERDSMYRLAEGIRIALANPDAVLIVSGYAFKDPVSQAEAYREAAVALGFPGHRIKLIDSGRDTYEEMLGVKQLLGEQPFALVTSAYHMPRSMASAYKAGLSPVAAPTWHKVKPDDMDFWTFVPSVAALDLTTRACHEYLGLIWYRLSGRL